MAHLRFPWISAKLPPETVARAIIGAIRRRKANLLVLPFQTLMAYYSTLILPTGIKDRLAWALQLQGWEI